MAAPAPPRKLSYDLPFPVWVGMVLATGPYVFATAAMLWRGEGWLEPCKLLAILVPMWLACMFPPKAPALVAATLCYGLACSVVFPLAILKMPLLRAMFGMACLNNCTARMAGMLTDEKLRTSNFGFRFAAVWWLHDLRTARVCPAVPGHFRALLTGLATQTLAGALLGGAALWCVRALDPWVPLQEAGFLGFAAGGWSLSWWLRSWAGAAFFFAVLLAVDAMYRVVPLLGAGLDLPTAFNKPWQSASLAEFWRDRFDLAVQDVLRLCVQRPARRLGLSKGAAVVATFFGSGLLHTHGVWVSGVASVSDAVLMLAFFMVHAALVVAEQALVPRGAGAGPTAAVMLLTTPLFVVPLLNVLGL